MSKCDCPPAMGGQFLLSGAGLPKNMYKSRKSVLLELLNIEICAILYNVYPKRKGNLTLLHYDAILFDVDGTLIDSAPGIINTLKEVFARMGVDTTNVNLRRYLGPPLRKSFGEHFTDTALIEKATDLYRDSYAVKGSHRPLSYIRIRSGVGVPAWILRLKRIWRRKGTRPCWSGAGDSRIRPLAVRKKARNYQNAQYHHYKGNRQNGAKSALFVRRLRLSCKFIKSCITTVIGIGVKAHECTSCYDYTL